MKLHNIALDDIVKNPWRDLQLYPLDKGHVAELRNSINDHGFFGGIKGRRRNGKVEIGCGHARIEAARKAGLETVAIYIDDIDDDGMLRLMTDENATQAGTNPGAVMNEVGAITQRLIDGLLSGPTIVGPARAAFENKAGIDQAIAKLRKGTDVHLALGYGIIRRYLGQGNAERSLRGERAIREAITALKQSGRYDDMVDEAIRKYPPPTDAKPSKSRAAATTEKKPRRKRILDERVANLFETEHTFQAFREAVTTPAAQKVLPVEGQYALAKSILKHVGQPEGDGSFRKKNIGAPFIKKMVHAHVQEAMKAQRSVDKEEREAYMREQREAAIDATLHSANASLRSLLSVLAKLNDLANEFPAHPKLGGFSARLDTLVGAIQQFSRKLK